METKHLFTLPKTERLYLRGAIDELFAKGQSFTVFPYRVTFLISGEKAGEQGQAEENAREQGQPEKTRELPPRQGRCAIMTVAPKKRFRHAVDRNHVKRLTREAYRLQKLPLVEALAARQLRMTVAFIYVDNHFLTFEQTHTVIGKALKRLIRSLDA